METGTILLTPWQPGCLVSKRWKLGEALPEVPILEVDQAAPLILLHSLGNALENSG